MREMKDSGIEWIGEIPADWDISKIKYLFTSGKGLPITKDNLIENGLPVVSYGQIHSKANTGTDIRECLLRYVDLRYQKHYPQCEVFQYDFIFADTSEDYDGCGNCVYKRDNSRLFGGYHAIILHSIYKEDNRYYAYLFKTDTWRKQLREAVSGVKVFSITQNILMSCELLVPPKHEQHRIADFLDAKCAELDALVADIQAQIDALEQYKRSVITEAVTKGLNPDAQMEDSGIKWAGEIPVHWKMIRGKYILKHLQKPVRKDDDVITCFRDGEVTLRSNRREDGFTFSDKEIGYQGIDVGDLVVHGMDGFAGAIGISDSRGKSSPVLNVLDTKQNKRYIMYYLRGMAYSDVFVALSTGIRVRSCDLNWNKLSELLYPIPPTDEQSAIVEYIDNTIAKANAAISGKKAQLDMLDAYKKSLIYEYVTGKKETPFSLHSEEIIGLDPHVIMAGMVIDQLGHALLGKTQLQKVLYLFDAYLGLNSTTQYYRFEHGPYDLNFDHYLNTLVENGWFRRISGKAEKYEKGSKHEEFRSRYENAFSQYKEGMIRLVSFVKGLKYTRQIERIATAFAVWNDLLLDGNNNPTDADIIHRIQTAWTPNKANTAEDTWKNTLDKMRRQGIIPKGSGQHTLPRPQRGTTHE